MSAPHFHLRSLSLHNVRKFTALNISGLNAGLNIIGGPNGIGKSSLVRAIQASFLDKYTSSSASDLQPLADSGAMPSVALDFDWQGQAYELRKSFLKNGKRCNLTRGSQQFENQAAEDHLADLMGYTHATKGNNVSNWGVPGLLWVNQGFSPEQFAARVQGAGQRLGHALHGAEASQAGTGSAAQLAATAGDALIAQLQDALGQYWGRNNQAVGDFKKQVDELQRLQTQHREQQQSIEAYRAQVDELAQLLAQVQQEAQDQPRAVWQQQLDEAQAQLQALQALQQQHSQDQQQWQQVQERLALLQQALGTYQQLVQQLAQRAQAVEAAEAALALASDASAQGSQAVEAAVARHAAARSAWERADQAKIRHDMAQRLQHMQAQAQRMQHTLNEAERAQQKMQQLVLGGYVYNIHTADLKRLRQLEDAVHTATLRRDALATQLHFALPDGQTLAWHSASGQPQGQWQGEGEAWLTQRTTVQLPGGGQLSITPGGGDVAQAAQALEQALAARHAEWQRLGVSSLAQAQTQFEQRQQQQIDLQVVQQLLESLAPHGPEALRVEYTVHKAHTTKLEKQLQELPEVHDAPDWAQAQRDWQAAQAAAEQANKAQQACLQQQAVATQQLQTARDEHAAARQLLEDPSTRARHAEHQQELLALQAQSDALKARIDNHAQQLQAHGGSFVAQDIERLQRTLRSHAEQVQQRQSRITELRGALQASGAQGLEESSAALAGEIARLQRRVDDTQRRAQALHTVLERLKAKRAAALHRLQAPLEARMRHYLQLLLPGGTVELNDQLVPVHVMAEGTPDAAAQRVAGAVEHLSYGTKEQLAIISRLAYADLLREAGHPTLLMMDDVLVHSDTQRLAQMKRVLFDAATRHQILLLTCRPQDWQDAGVAVRSLQEGAVV